MPQDFYEDPKRLVFHVNDRWESENPLFAPLRNPAAFIMKVAYGYNVKDDNDPYLHLAEEGIRLGSLGGAPGRWLVDSFPIRKHTINDESFVIRILTYNIDVVTVQFLPDWCPGAGFKRKAKEWGKRMKLSLSEPFHFVKRQLVSF
jgi:hypothetical protein